MHKRLRKKHKKTFTWNNDPALSKKFFGNNILPTLVMSSGDWLRGPRVCENVLLPLWNITEYLGYDWLWLVMTGYCCYLSSLCTSSAPDEPNSPPILRLNQIFSQPRHAGCLKTHMLPTKDQCRNHTAILHPLAASQLVGTSIKYLPIRGLITSMWSLCFIFLYYHIYAQGLMLPPYLSSTARASLSGTRLNVVFLCLKDTTQ